MLGRAVNQNGQTVIAELEQGTGFFSRALGLMGRKNLPAGRGILLRPCAAVHTSFMRFPLDLIFLDREQRVVRIVCNVKPWHIVRGGHRAYAVLEVKAGWLPANALHVGDRLEWVSGER